MLSDMMGFDTGQDIYKIDFSVADSFDSRKLLLEDLPNQVELVIKKKNDTYIVSIYPDSGKYETYKLLGSTITFSHKDSNRPPKLFSLKASSIDVLAHRMDNLLFCYAGRLECNLGNLTPQEKCVFKDYFSS